MESQDFSELQGPSKKITMRLLIIATALNLVAGFFVPIPFHTITQKNSAIYAKAGTGEEDAKGRVLDGVLSSIERSYGRGSIMR